MQKNSRSTFESVRCNNEVLVTMKSSVLSNCKDGTFRANEKACYIGFSTNQEALYLDKCGCLMWKRGFEVEWNFKRLVVGG